MGHHRGALDWPCCSASKVPACSGVAAPDGSRFSGRKQFLPGGF